MQLAQIAFFFAIAGPSSTFVQAFNLSSAECFNPKEVAAINLFMEWSAFNVDGSDGYCYDDHGTGYESGQYFISCGGCIKFNCTTRPCNDRDGSKFKMFWMLESVATQCCQDCDGKIFPLNSAVSTTNLGDRCDTVEHAICKTSSNLSSVGPVGTIEVSYTSGNCCLDENTFSPAGTTILEKDTCSARTCMQGRPAHWDRHAIYQGGCGCCEFKSALVLPGECHTLTDGRQACCCDGEMVITVKQTTEHQPTLKQTIEQQHDVKSTTEQHQTVKLTTEQQPTVKLTTEQQPTRYTSLSFGSSVESSLSFESKNIRLISHI